MRRISTFLSYAWTAGGILSLSLASAHLAFGGPVDQWHLQDADHFDANLPAVETAEEWKQRKAEIRQKLLVTAGLWPTPSKCPLKAQVFGQKTGHGFTVAKVYFETLPGFFATGNLYKPTSGNGPFPAILTPHGHWRYGRLQNGESGSIPGRCIDFARQGYVVLSLDMVGYNDSFQVPHDANKSRAQLKADKPLPYEPNLFRAEFDFPRASLYGFSLGGLQLWNSIRALDFLTSLPEVDSERLGVTGASGGATQTIFAMIADERVKVAAPVNIIGARKHPGCFCENISGLWVDTSTIEMSAAFSPRPLLLMSATEDPWTNSTPVREYPLIRRYYEFHNAAEALKNVHISAGHNYNAETRAAVYEWFHRHLQPDLELITDPVPVSTEVAKLGDLRVFPEKLLPESSVSAWQVIKNWIADSERIYEESLPTSGAALDHFIDQFRPALKLVLSAHTVPSESLSTRSGSPKSVNGFSYQSDEVERLSGVGWLEIESLATKQRSHGNVLMVFPETMGSLAEPDSKGLEQAINALLSRGFRLFRVRGFASGQVRIPKADWEAFSWPDAYNRSNQLSSVQDILLGVSFIEKNAPGLDLQIMGLGTAGVPTAFAAAVSGRAKEVILDLDGRDPDYDGELLELMPVGAIKRVGDFRTAVLLLLRGNTSIMNAGPTFDKEWYRSRAEELGLSSNLSFSAGLSEALRY